MFKPACFLLMACAFVPLVVAIPPPKCKAGFGLVDPKMFPYGVAKPGDCKACAVAGCRTCLENYKKCDTCAAASGLNSGKTKCIKCKSSFCGVCNDNYKVCDAKIAKCGLPPLKTVASAAKKGPYAPSKNFDYCQSKPGFEGNGYSSLFTATVKDGVCIDCNSRNFRPYFEGGTRFCSFDLRGRGVAAMAFEKKSGCAYPGSIKFTLKRTCLAQSRNLPFSVNLVYSAEYCGEKRTVIASGGGYYKGSDAVIDPANKWKYIVQP
ncbi:hypothetical protein NADE_007169 [Nannochloris sp. 'desiccata']|nr:hypothetical protein NADE_007169 [Chlorella desiccata (nom. nud.)]